MIISENDKDLLKLVNISKKFPGVRALNGVNFNINKSEIVSIVGQNGAGKSTLVNIIGGIYQPDTGEIYIEGKRKRIFNPLIAEKIGIGMVHQESTLVPALSVYANLFLNREHTKNLFFLNFHKMKQNTKEIFNVLGYKIEPNLLVEDLSLIERRVLEIAKAMFFNPNILILDEVTASFGAKEVDRLFGLMKELKSKGMSIIFISHRLQEATKISDQVVVLRDGERVGDFRKEEKFSIEKIINLMLGKKVKKEARKRRKIVNKKKKLLTVKNLSRVSDFNNLDFNLHAGEILGFAGFKGSRITEIFKTLYGILSKSSGEILFKDHPVIIRSPKDALQLGIGMITNDREKEGIALIRSLEENINISSLDKFTNKLFVFNPKILVNNAKKFIKDIEIKTPSVKQEVLYLSGGNRQKVLLAKFLLRGLDILIVDEPTKGIDVKTKGAIHDLLNRLKFEGKGIIITSPEIPELLSICDRILIVAQGQIEKEITSSQKDFNEANILHSMHV